jgi:hypothetical protein
MIGEQRREPWKRERVESKGTEKSRRITSKKKKMEDLG